MKLKLILYDLTFTLLFSVVTHYVKTVHTAFLVPGSICTRFPNMDESCVEKSFDYSFESDTVPINLYLFRNSWNSSKILFLTTRVCRFMIICDRPK